MQCEQRTRELPMKDLREPFEKKEGDLTAAIQNFSILLRQDGTELSFRFRGDNSGDGIPVAQLRIEAAPPVPAGSLSNANKECVIRTLWEEERTVGFLREPAIRERQRKAAFTAGSIGERALYCIFQFHGMILDIADHLAAVCIRRKRIGKLRENSIPNPELLFLGFGGIVLWQNPEAQHAVCRRADEAILAETGEGTGEDQPGRKHGKQRKKQTPSCVWMLHCKEISFRKHNRNKITRIELHKHQPFRIHLTVFPDNG